MGYVKGRQFCVHCGAKYGRRNTTDHKIVETDGQFRTVSKWDGQTYYTKYEPFCTLRCALSYARWAYNKYAHGRERRRALDPLKQIKVDMEGI